MPNTRITKERMKNHYQYTKMIYIGIIVIAAMLGDLLFTVTTYQSPNARRVDIHLISHYINFDCDTEAYAQQALAVGQAYEKERDRAAGIDVDAADYEVPLEEVTIVGVMFDENSEDSYYQQQKYSLTLTAQEGDIFILSREMMNGLAETGMLTDLTPFIDSGILQPGDIQQVMYYEYDPDYDAEFDPPRNKCVYGLSTSSLSGMYRALGIDYREKYMVILSYSQNSDTVASIMQWMIDEFTPAEGTEATPEATQAVPSATEIVPTVTEGVPEANA